jgi:hypothetical protein
MGNLREYGNLGEEEIDIKYILWLKKERTGMVLEVIHYIYLRG